MPTERTESTEVRLLQGGALVPKCTNVARSALTLRKLPQNARNPQKFRVSREETTESVVKILILSGGLRSPSNRVAFAVRLDCVRCPIRLRPPYDDRTIAFIAQKQWFHRTKSAISSGKSSTLSDKSSDFIERPRHLQRVVEARTQHSVRLKVVEHGDERVPEAVDVVENDALVV